MGRWSVNIWNKSLHADLGRSLFDKVLPSDERLEVDRESSIVDFWEKTSVIYRPKEPTSSTTIQSTSLGLWGLEAAKIGILLSVNQTMTYNTTLEACFNQ